MDEKIKDQEVLLVKEQKDENLKAVAGTDEKGGLKTVSPTAQHEQNFLMNLCAALAAYCFFENNLEVLPVRIEKSGQLELF